jgi:hypothetical protein
MVVLPALALLTTALLFGGSLLYSAAFAAFPFRYLPPPQAGSLLRQAFPHFYLGTLLLAGLTALLLLVIDRSSGVIMAIAALAAVPARQLLMPAINAASDAGDRRRFHGLHGLSVLLGLAQIAAYGWVLLRIAL